MPHPASSPGLVLAENVPLLGRPSSKLGMPLEPVQEQQPPAEGGASDKQQGVLAALAAAAATTAAAGRPGSPAAAAELPLPAAVACVVARA